MLISNLVKKLQKKSHTHKNYKPTNFTDISKSGKSAYFRHVYYFGAYFTTFSRDLKSA